jgi:hypothetical protein
MNTVAAIVYAWFWKPLLDLIAFCLLLGESA